MEITINTNPSTRAEALRLMLWAWRNYKGINIPCVAKVRTFNPWEEETYSTEVLHRCMNMDTETAIETTDDYGYLTRGVLIQVGSVNLRSITHLRLAKGTQPTRVRLSPPPSIMDPLEAEAYYVGE